MLQEFPSLLVRGLVVFGGGGGGGLLPEADVLVVPPWVGSLSEQEGQPDRQGL